MGVNTFPKIICIACRTVPIQSALCSPDLGECFRYPQRVCNMRKKFPRGLWSSSVCSKNGVKSTFETSLACLIHTFFEQTLELYSPLGNFLRMLHTRCGHLKHSPRSGEHSALWIRTVRHAMHIIFWKSVNTHGLDAGLDFRPMAGQKITKSLI